MGKTGIKDLRDVTLPKWYTLSPVQINFVMLESCCSFVCWAFLYKLYHFIKVKIGSFLVYSEQGPY